MFIRKYAEHKIKNSMERKYAAIKANELIRSAIKIAVFTCIFPDAIGRLLFIGCCLSASLSKISFK